MKHLFATALLLFLASAGFAEETGKWGWGVDAGFAVKWGAPGANLPNALLETSRPRLVGELGASESVFLQTGPWYASLQMNYTGEIALFDSPGLEDGGFWGLVGVAYPPYHPDNFWNVSAAVGFGADWGILHGRFLEEIYMGSRYERITFAVPALPAELKASLRFAQHFGLGLKYVVSINSRFSSNMFVLFVEGLL